MSTPSGSSSVSRGRMSSTQRRTLAWPMRSCTCLSNIVSIGRGSAVAAVDADDRDGAAPADDVDRGVQRGQAVDAGGLHELLGHGVGQQRRRPSGPPRPTGEPWASMPTASITASGPRPSVSSRTARPRRRPRPQVDDLDTAGPGPREPLGHEVDADHCCDAAVQGDAGRPCRRSGRGPRTATRAAVGHGGVLHGLPGGGQHVGEEEEAVVGRPSGTLIGP